MTSMERTTALVADSTRSAEGAELTAPPALLGFYDRLRQRIERGLARKGGRLGERGAQVLLLAPDLFVLLLRLSLDREVPRRSRALVAGGLAYFVLPVDLLPELVVGFGGYLDDVVVAAAILSEAFGRDLRPWAARYWSGSRELHVVLQDLTGAVDALLGADLAGRLRSLLSRRGIELR